MTRLLKSLIIFDVSGVEQLQICPNTEVRQER